MRLVTTILFFLFTTIMLYGQESPTFSTHEMESFVTIYQEVEQFPPINDTVIWKMLKDAEISMERYAEIMTSKLNRGPIKMNDAECLTLDRIRILNESQQIEKNAFANSKCAQYGLTVHRYEEILHAYQTDLAFQQTMQPYFEKHHKGLKE